MFVYWTMFSMSKRTNLPWQFWLSRIHIAAVYSAAISLRSSELDRPKLLNDCFFNWKKLMLFEKAALSFAIAFLKQEKPS